MKYLKQFEELKPSTWKSAYNKEEENIENLRKKYKKNVNITSNRSPSFYRKYLKGIFNIIPINSIQKSDVLFSKGEITKEEYHELNSIMNFYHLNDKIISKQRGFDIIIEKVGDTFYKLRLDASSNKDIYLMTQVFYFNNIEYIKDYLKQF